MGVLPCDRLGCENVMCDRLSDRYGYICRECLDELVALGTTDIQGFMGQELEQKEKPSREFYEGIVPDRRD